MEADEEDEGVVDDEDDDAAATALPSEAPDDADITGALPPTGTTSPEANEDNDDDDEDGAEAAVGGVDAGEDGAGGCLPPLLCFTLTLVADVTNGAALLAQLTP